MKITFNKKWFTPLYFILKELLADESIRTILIYGGKSCFGKNQCVVTADGNKPISNINIGESVLSFNEKTQQKEFKKVENIFKFKNEKRSVKIKLKSGEEIICTEDHLFYFWGEWVSIKQILSLWNETNPKL